MNKIKFTGQVYRCPRCGSEINGYLESFWKTPTGQKYNDEFYWKEIAGCCRCADCWDVSELKNVTREKVQFT